MTPAPARRGIALANAWPDDWKGLLGPGPLAFGFDPATTEGKKSNPSALAIVERVGMEAVVRAVVRWKTSDPAVTRAMIERALDLPNGRRPRRLCVDATSERFFATDLQRHLAGRVFVELVITSEVTKYGLTPMSLKVYTGNLVVNAVSDALLLLPNAGWLSKDLRQPEGGTFRAEVDEAGNHADCFVAIALALHGLSAGGGPALALPTPVGQMSSGGSTPVRPGVRGPIGQLVGAVRRAVNV